MNTPQRPKDMSERSWMNSLGKEDDVFPYVKPEDIQDTPGIRDTKYDDEDVFPYVTPEDIASDSFTSDEPNTEDDVFPYIGDSGSDNEVGEIGYDTTDVFGSDYNDIEMPTEPKDSIPDFADEYGLGDVEFDVPEEPEDKFNSAFEVKEFTTQGDDKEEPTKEIPLTKSVIRDEVREFSGAFPEQFDKLVKPLKGAWTRTLNSEIKKATADDEKALKDWESKIISKEKSIKKLPAKLQKEKLAEIEEKRKEFKSKITKNKSSTTRRVNDTYFKKIHDIISKFKENSGGEQNIYMNNRNPIDENATPNKNRGDKPRRINIRTEKQLELLLQSREKLNDFGVGLPIRIVGLNLPRVNLSALRICGVHFEDCNFSGGNFTEAKFKKCWFKNVDFTHANFSGSVIEHCVAGPSGSKSPEDSPVMGTIPSAIEGGEDISITIKESGKTSFNSADFTFSTINGSVFKDTDFCRTNLNNASVSWTSWEGTSAFCSVNVKDANFKNTTFRGIRKKGTNFKAAGSLDNKTLDSIWSSVASKNTFNVVHDTATDNRETPVEKTAGQQGRRNNSAASISPSKTNAPHPRTRGNNELGDVRNGERVEEAPEWVTRVLSDHDSLYSVRSKERRDLDIPDDSYMFPRPADDDRGIPTYESKPKDSFLKTILEETEDIARSLFERSAKKKAATKKPAKKGKAKDKVKTKEVKKKKRKNESLSEERKPKAKDKIATHKKAADKKFKKLLNSSGFNF